MGPTVDFCVYFRFCSGVNRLFRFALLFLEALVVRIALLAELFNLGFDFLHFDGRWTFSAGELGLRQVVIGVAKHFPDGIERRPFAGSFYPLPFGPQIRLGLGGPGGSGPEALFGIPEGLLLLGQCGKGSLFFLFWGRLWRCGWYCWRSLC